MATTDLWVYNAENLCVSFFYQVTFIFHLRGGKIQKKFFLGLPNIDLVKFSHRMMALLLSLPIVRSFLPVGMTRGKNLQEICYLSTKVESVLLK